MAKDTPYPIFDRSRLRLMPLASRHHDMALVDVMALDADVPRFDAPEFDEFIGRVAAARKAVRPVIFMMGAHVIKKGCSRFVIDMMERGLITHVAANGAAAIHDFELALIGATTESVARYIREGQFGLWEEEGLLHDAFAAGVRDGLGMGQAVGRAIEAGKFPHRDVSIAAAGYRLGIPVTFHVGIGYDIIHEHPKMNGAVVGEASYMDFLVFARAVEGLDGGAFLNFGTAVMGPEVYLKALSMARNVALQDGRSIRDFTTAVFDLQDLPDDYRSELPRNEAHYYYRPWKTILVRTVADGGTSYYFRGDHAVTVPNLARRAAAAMAGRA